MKGFLCVVGIASPVRVRWFHRPAFGVTEAYAELPQSGEVEEFGLPAWKRLVSRR